MTEPLITGTGYLNLNDETAYGGQILVYEEWVTVQTTDNHANNYTVPRQRVAFINWKDL